jgi:hypothetical protein
MPLDLKGLEVCTQRLSRSRLKITVRARDREGPHLAMQYAMSILAKS